jgi:hypothetical protein
VSPEKLVISIDQGAAYTNSRKVTLNLSALDYDSGIAGMAFSTDSVTWTAWEAFKPHKEFTLPFGDGRKVVYFMVKDKAGNTETSFDNIILDTEPPYSLSILITSSSFKTKPPTVMLSLSALDETSGVARMAFSFDNIVWTSWEGFSKAKTLNLTVMNEENIIFFKVTDKVNNTAEPVSLIFMVNLTELDDMDNKTDGNGDENNGTDQNTGSGTDGEEDFFIFSFLGMVLISVIIVIVLVLFLVFVFIIRKKKEVQTGNGTEITLEPSITMKPGEKQPPVITLESIDQQPKGARTKSKKARGPGVGAYEDGQVKNRRNEEGSRQN